MGQGLLIVAGQLEQHYWREIWRYRGLFYFLTWRNMLVRYKQTFFGVAWALIRPLLMMVILTVVFSKLARLPADGDSPYSVMVYAALLPWQFFSTSISSASNSLISDSNLIAKVYFPRLIIPISSVVTSLVDFAIAFSILLAMMVWYDFWPTWRILVLPLFIGIALLLSIGIGTLLASMVVKFRDLRQVIPFMVQLGLYASPVGFSSSVIPEQYRLLYSLNPMVGVIDGFRWAILGNSSPLDITSCLISLLVGVLLLFLGIRAFKKTERTFADII